MSRTFGTLLLSTVLCVANAAASGAADSRRQEEYSCAEGYHWYAICPYHGYCNQTSPEMVCKMLCPQWDEEDIYSDGCEQFGACESLACTFGGN